MTPGTTVRFHGRYLKSTGQQRSPEGQKAFVVVACSCTPCTRGEWVAVNESSAYAPEEPRHIARANLQAKGPDGRWIQAARFCP